MSDIDDFLKIAFPDEALDMVIHTMQGASSPVEAGVILLDFLASILANTSEVYNDGDLVIALMAGLFTRFHDHEAMQMYFKDGKLS